MGHRDDDEALRARNAALERQLADAHAKAEHVEAEAERLRVALSARARPSSERGWTERERNLHYRASVVLSVVVFVSAGGAMIAVFDGVIDSVLFPGLLGVSALVAGHVVLGAVTGARRVLRGALVTIASASATTAWGWALSLLIDAAIWMPAPLLLLLRIACFVAMIAVGAVLTATWSMEASEPKH